MNEAMKQAWLEISQMLGEPTREELDVFLRTWQRASQATREALAEQPAQQALDKMAENARELGLDYEPAQRTWVGLTDADKQEAFDETQEASGGFWEFADYLEAKLKEKNT